MHFGHPRLGSTTGFHGQRCCGLVPWSWIIVCVRKAKSGGYPKVTAGNRLAKHGAPFAALLVAESLRFEIIAAVPLPTRCSGKRKPEPPTVGERAHACQAPSHYGHHPPDHHLMIFDPAPSPGRAVGAVGLPNPASSFMRSKTASSFSFSSSAAFRSRSV